MARSPSIAVIAVVLVAVAVAPALAALDNPAVLERRQMQGDPCIAFQTLAECSNWQGCSYYRNGSSSFADPSGYCAFNCERFFDAECGGFSFCHYDATLRRCTNEPRQCTGNSISECEFPSCQYNMATTNPELIEQGLIDIMAVPCTTNCELHISPVTCDRADGCYWDEDTPDPSGRKCRHQPFCGYTSDFECANSYSEHFGATPCSWDPAHNYCFFNCEQMHNSKLCNSFNCRWHDAFDACVYPTVHCANYDEMECNMNAPACQWYIDELTYVFDPVTNTTVPAPAFCTHNCGHHTTEYGCELNYECHWNAAWKQCFPGHRAVNSDPCTEQYIASSPSPAGRTCADFAEGVACKILAGQVNSTQPEDQCVLDCASLTAHGEATCKSLGYCIWHTDKNLCTPPIFDCHAFRGKKNCPVRSGVCAWETLGLASDAIQDDMIRQYEEDLHGPHHGYFDGEFCRADCEFHDVAEQCTMHPECAWFETPILEAGGYCGYNGTFNDTSVTCHQLDFFGCHQWNPFCLWGGPPDDAHCISNCEFINDHTDCLTAGCLWTEHNQCIYRPVDCESFTQLDECVHHWKQCSVAWDGSWSCGKAPCHSNWMQYSCELDGDFCEWNPVNATCDAKPIDCGDILYQHECDRAPQCFWSVNSGKCSTQPHGWGFYYVVDSDDSIDELMKWYNESRRAMIEAFFKNHSNETLSGDPNATPSIAGSSSSSASSAGMIALIAVVVVAVVGVGLYAKKRLTNSSSGSAQVHPAGADNDVEEVHYQTVHVASAP